MIQRTRAIRSIWRSFSCVVILLCCLTLPAVMASQPTVMTEALRAETINRVFSSDKFKQLVAGEPLRPLSVFIEEEKQDDGKAAAPEAIVTLVSYRSGKGVQARVSLSSGEVIEIRRLAGRPQASEEERAEAQELILHDPVVRRVLDQGGYVVGGFVVDAPSGSEKPGRYLEFHVVARDRPKLIQEVIVDLSARRVAAVRSEDPSSQR
jgi:hypothetical protein